jgi:uncharacterized protein (DUF983 family)
MKKGRYDIVIMIIGAIIFCIGLAISFTGHWISYVISFVGISITIIVSFFERNRIKGIG